MVKNANTCLGQGQTKVAQAGFTKPSCWLFVDNSYFLKTTKLHLSAQYDHTGHEEFHIQPKVSNKKQRYNPCFPKM